MGKEQMMATKVFKSSHKVLKYARPSMAFVVIFFPLGGPRDPAIGGNEPLDFPG